MINHVFKTSFFFMKNLPFMVLSFQTTQAVVAFYNNLSSAKLDTSVNINNGPSPDNSNMNKENERTIFQQVTITKLLRSHSSCQKSGISRTETTYLIRP